MLFVRWMTTAAKKQTEQYHVYSQLKYSLTPLLQEKWVKVRDEGSKRNIEEYVPLIQYGVSRKRGNVDEKRIVNIKDHTCTCGYWQDMKFPCVHAAAVISKNKLNYLHYIDPIYQTLLIEINLLHSNCTR